MIAAVVKKNFETLRNVIIRYGLFIGIILLCFFAGEQTGETARHALSGAYISVSTFVAFTLALFYSLEHIFKLDTESLLKKYPKSHIPVAAFMGGLPGCGGAIIIMTQFVSGRLGFGSVVAVLTSTMGDAAFLLLAQEPKTAALVFSISFIVGIISGYIVDAIHGPDFLKHEREAKQDFIDSTEKENGINISLQYLWLALMIPGFSLGIANALQIDANEWFGSWASYNPVVWIGFVGALLSAFMWSLNANMGPSIVNLSGKLIETKGWKVHLERVIIDTNFVTIWVIMAFLLFELTVLWTQVDLESLFKIWQPFLPLMGVIFGLIPGCGPQILVTTFYLNGLIPLSAQFANAISNDGDALFPAIALAPRSALLATIYTIIPALIVSYGWYFFME